MITPSQLTPILDNITQTLLDLDNNLVTGLMTAVSTVQAGQHGASNSLQARVAALVSHDLLNSNLGKAWGLTAQKVHSYIVIDPVGHNKLMGDILVALDKDLGGLAHYLATNNLMVHRRFADAFNYVAANTISLGLAPGPLAPITPAQVFVPALQTLATFNATGATTGTFGAGTPIDTTKYAPSQLFIKNVGGAGTTGTATSFSATYTKANGQTGIGNQALSGSLAAGATLQLDTVLAVAVTAISITSGVSGDQFAIVVLPLRTVGY